MMSWVFPILLDYAECHDRHSELLRIRGLGDGRNWWSESSQNLHWHEQAIMASLTRFWSTSLLSRAILGRNSSCRISGGSRYRRRRRKPSSWSRCFSCTL
ncbi:hypothetical protein BDZ89DRAFT_1077033 [Hymenopellis radicata]|nr:hypothetical protein BDZ89DRAFT_1077033 [Hymenopellis radicata]